MLDVCQATMDTLAFMQSPVTCEELQVWNAQLCRTLKILESKEIIEIIWGIIVCGGRQSMYGRRTGKHSDLAVFWEVFFLLAFHGFVKRCEYAQ